LPPEIKEKIQQSAIIHRRSINSEVIARLAESFALDPVPFVPSQPLASDTAIEALELARRNRDRIEFLEKSLLEIGTADEFLDTLSGPAQALFQKMAGHLREKT
jgi:hypothetical protein